MGSATKETPVQIHISKSSFGLNRLRYINAFGNHIKLYFITSVGFPGYKKIIYYGPDKPV